MKTAGEELRAAIVASTAALDAGAFESDLTALQTAAAQFKLDLSSVTKAAQVARYLVPFVPGG